MAIASSESAARPDVFIFSMPRTASNLLVKMLSKQEQVIQKLYAYEEGFQEAMEIAATNPGQASDKGWELVSQQFNNEWAKLQTDLEHAKAQGETLLVKEHVSHITPPNQYWKSTFENRTVEMSFSNGTISDTWTNGTIYPDAFLLQWFPVFLIRHPALAFPSFLRLISSHGSAIRPILAAAFFNYTFTRQLYEWYVAQPKAQHPLIIDADQIMRPHEFGVVATLCDRTGLDKERIIYTWEPATAEEKARSPYRRLWGALKTIKEPSGIVPGLTADHVFIDEEIVKWKEEFGDEGADLLEKHVRAAMTDYEWLKARQG